MRCAVVAFKIRDHVHHFCRWPRRIARRCHGRQFGLERLHPALTLDFDVLVELDTRAKLPLATKAGKRPR